MLPYAIAGRVSIITGATKGMGLATARAFLSFGARVVMVYCRDRENAERVLADFDQYRDSLLLIKADITQEADRQRIVREALAHFGKIDILVNNAGVPAKASFLKETVEQFDHVLDVNLKAPVMLAKLVAYEMIQQDTGGSIINFSSVCGHRAMGGISYDAAKAGIIRASQTMANALGKYKIRVNSISPGTHKTEMNRHHWENETPLHQAMLSVTALERAAEADEIVGTVLYLASDQSSYTTGTDILVDGGYLSHCPGRKV